ncbi:hypothetical protein [Prochlorococcus marinus]|uniref:Polysaccharide deacetylase n=1 Tax=Prochlorococcus marinus XMU1408 TaxID=2213228 RepID=A0A318R479_PROMR|nr:hypothetical protein [Prochlorococcus marinus]MBW3041846.1 hypothetical protein [Prochlorococcus marinus str. XMU1408]PYE02984.1 hypothetical protein DNJ73_04345 [Prochlorococcus marinus XMU1408]
MYGINSLEKFLIFFIENNYSFRSFEEDLNSKNKIINLRHDIDFSLEEALKIAILENKINIKANYFIMLTSNTYNPLSQYNQDIIKQIKELGHNISLHFDPEAYQDIDNGLINEKEIFERYFQVKIKLVSLHRPGKFLNNNNRKLPNVDHTYQDKYFKSMCYYSDSAGVDIRKKIDLNTKQNIKKQFHILIHPIWWTNVTSSPTETLLKWIKLHEEFIILETKKNCKSFLYN